MNTKKQNVASVKMKNDLVYDSSLPNPKSQLKKWMFCLSVVGEALTCERAMKMTLAASRNSIVLEVGSTTIMSPLSLSSSPVLLLCSLIYSPSLCGLVAWEVSKIPRASNFKAQNLARWSFVCYVFRLINVGISPLIFFWCTLSEVSLFNLCHCVCFGYTFGVLF